MRSPFLTNELNPFAGYAHQARLSPAAGLCAGVKGMLPPDGSTQRSPYPHGWYRKCHSRPRRRIWSTSDVSSGTGPSVSSPCGTCETQLA